MKKREQTQRELQEDAILNKVLWWIVGAVVIEFVVLLINRFAVNYTVAGIDLAISLRAVLKVLAVVLPICFVLLLVCFLAARKSGRGVKLLGVLTVLAAALAVCAVVSTVYGGNGIKFLYIAVPAVAVLALIYYLYQREFFLVAVLGALGLLGVRVVPHDAGTLAKAVVFVVVLAIILVLAVVFCRMLQTKKGYLSVKGELKQILPKNANYAMLYLTCAIVAVVVALAFFLGALTFLYGILVAWLLIMAVYYTVRLM